MKLTTDNVNDIVNLTIKGCDIHLFPIKSDFAPSDTDRYLGEWTFIPVLIAPEQTKAVQKKMGERAAKQAQAATDGYRSTCCFFQTCPDDPGRGTITIRCC